MDSTVKIEKKDLLELLLHLKDEKGEKINDEALLCHVFTFMLAGHETTSIGMTWTMFLLAKHPLIQQQVQEEIDTAIRDAKNVSWDDLDNLKFLDCCIKESTRLYPPGVYVLREAIKEDKIGPYVIPANTPVSVDIGALQQDSRFWKDAAVFNPARFQSTGECCLQLLARFGRCFLPIFRILPDHTWLSRVSYKRFIYGR